MGCVTPIITFFMVVLLLDGVTNVVAIWGPWSSWSACPTSCGRSEVERRRSCLGRGGHDGANCEGGSMETKETQCGPDIVPGHWSQWNYWRCVWCDGLNDAEARAERRCRWPSNAQCKGPCEGEAERPCEEYWCIPTDYCARRQYTTWGEWGAWDVTCGSYALRFRQLPCEFVGRIPEGKRDCGAYSYMACDEDSGQDDWQEQERNDLPPCPQD